MAKIKIFFLGFQLKLRSLLARYQGRVLVLIALVLFGCIAYLWYNTIAYIRWDDDRVAEYKKEQSQKVNFNQAKFEKVTQEIEARQKEFSQPLPAAPDIFRIK